MPPWRRTQALTGEHRWCSHRTPMSRARTSRASSGSSLDVVCFGEILWDIYGVDPPRGSSSHVEPIARDLRRELGGAPANVATGLARLGVRAGLVAGIG